MTTIPMRAVGHEDTPSLIRRMDAACLFMRSRTVELLPYTLFSLSGATSNLGLAPKGTKPLAKREHPTGTNRKSHNEGCGWKGGDRGGFGGTMNALRGIGPNLELGLPDGHFF